MATWYEHEFAIDPSLPLEDATAALPGRWAVYLMCDANRNPVQLLAVRNLRASIRRRLSPDAPQTLTKRVDYRTLVRYVRYARVDSPIESDLAYLQAAKQAFASTYRQLFVQRQQSWWLHVDPEAAFPRWSRIEGPLAPPGRVFGPVQDKSQAQKLIETLEDAFDLCRYHTILSQAPAGTACAYKEMGKCPAPCDGSVSMQQYRSLVRWSADTLADPQTEIAQQADRMRQAAGDLRFELAGKIKQFIDQLSSLRKSEWRFVRPIEDFRYLSIQPGPRKGHAKLFSITPERIEPVACIIREPESLLLHCDAIRQLIRVGPESPACFSPPLEGGGRGRGGLPGGNASETQASPHPALPLKGGGNATLDSSAIERLGIAVRHLFWAKSGGVYLHGDDINERSLSQAYRQIARREVVTEESEDEGVITEMRSS
jgi:hypothetical protein